MPLLILLSLFGFASLLQRVTGRPMVLCAFACVAGVADVMYIAGLCGCLHFAAHALFAAGLAAGAAAIAYALGRGRMRDYLAESLSPGPLFLFGGAAAFWIMYHRLTYYGWDEFSHWGLAARDLTLSNRLPGPDTLTVFQDYPPGTGVFYYFFTSNAAYSEGLVYLAHFVLNAAPLALVALTLTWRKPHWVALTLAWMLLLCAVCWPLFFSVYVETLLSAYFAMMLYLYFTSERPSVSLPFMVPALFLLPVIKKTGAFFAAIFLVVVCVDMALRALPEGKGLMARLKLAGLALSRALSANRPAVLPALAAPVFVVLAMYGQHAIAWACIALAAIMVAIYYRAHLFPVLRRMAAPGTRGTIAVWTLIFAAPILSAISWQEWVKANGLKGTFVAQSIAGDAVRTAASAENTLQTRVNAFEERFMHHTLSVYDESIYSRVAGRLKPLHLPAGPRLSAGGWTLLALIIFASAVWLLRDRWTRTRLVAVMTLVLAFFAVYLVGLFSLYLAGFTASESEVLSAFERYVWTYILAVQLLAWSLVVFAGTRHGVPVRTGRVALVLCAAFTGWVYLFENPVIYIWPRHSCTRIEKERERMRPLVGLVAANTAPTDKVFMVLQDPPLMRYWVLRYDVVPRHVAIMRCLTRTSDTGESTVTFEMDPSEWRKALSTEGYTHVYIPAIDDSFWQAFGGFFDPDRAPTDMLFAVKRTRGADITLVPIRPVLPPAPEPIPVAAGVW